MSLAVRFDYFQGTGFCSSFSLFEDLIDSLCQFLPLGDSWAFRRSFNPSKLSFFSSFCSVRGGLRGVLRRDPKSFDYRFALHLPGTYCSQLPSDNFLSVVKLLSDFGFKFTRVDIAVDDYSRCVTFDEVKELGEFGNYRLVDSYKLIQKSIIRGTPSIPTVYFGSSAKILRFYNAEFVHGILADRWELQLRDDHARCVISDYLEDQSCLGSFVTGAVDFGTGDLSDRNFVRFDWWQSFHDRLGSLRINLPTFNPCFERSLKWLREQVAPTLSVAYYGYGQQGFNELMIDLVSDGSKRLKPYHQAWINELKKEFENV